jgi:hypothetical protein
MMQPFHRLGWMAVMVVMVAQVDAFQPIDRVVIINSRATTSTCSSRPRFVIRSLQIDGGSDGSGESTVVVTAANREETITSANNKKKQSSSTMQMPWSEFHQYALDDNLPKYTRTIFLLSTTTDESTSSTTNNHSRKSYALWRTMLQEVPELTGYPISFLREKYSPRVETTQASSLDLLVVQDSETKNAPEVLPFLDNFYFESSGGLSGQVSESSLWASETLFYIWGEEDVVDYDRTS